MKHLKSPKRTDLVYFYTVWYCCLEKFLNAKNNHFYCFPSPRLLNLFNLSIIKIIPTGYIFSMLGFLCFNVVPVDIAEFRGILLHGRLNSRSEISNFYRQLFSFAVFSAGLKI